MFLPSGIRTLLDVSPTEMLLHSVHLISHVMLCHKVPSTRSTYQAVFSFTLSRFTGIRPLEQSLNCTTGLFCYSTTAIPAFSTTLILKPCRFIGVELFRSGRFPHSAHGNPAWPRPTIKVSCRTSRDD